MEEDGRLVQFIYNHRGEVITEESGEAGLIRYIRGLGIVSSDSEQAKTYYHYVCDYAGSTSYVMNEQGNVENEYLYDAFGNITASAENVPNRFCYTGEQYDRIPNQYYLRARYYNPVIGKFTQQDTYLGAGLNLYAYCGGNPLSYVDPSGHTQQSAGDNAENNYGCIQTPEALQQPSIQAWMDKCIKSQMDFVQEGVDAMTNNVYGKEGTSADPVQSAGSLSDVNSGPKTTALMVIDSPGSLVPALYKPFDYSTMGSQGGDANQTTALAPVAPFGSYEIVPFRNDTGTNPLDVAQSSAVAAAISDAGGGESGRSSAEKCNIRATELNNARGEYEAQMGTTSVMEAIDNDNGNVVYLVSTNLPQKSAPKSIRNLLADNDIYIGGAGHAEQTIMNNKGNRYTVVAGGTSRNVCKDICQPLLEADGLTLGGPTFRGNSDKTKYRQFWRQ